MTTQAPFSTVSGVYSFSAATSGNTAIQILPLSNTGQVYDKYFIENQGTVIAYVVLGATKNLATTIVVPSVGTPGNSIPVLPGTSIVLPGPQQAWFNAQSASSTATLVIAGGNGTLGAFGSGSGGGGGGGSGTVTSVDASGGVETSSGSPITATGTIRGAVAVNAQTGTTYTYLTGDRGKLVTHTNASAIAGTLPQATGTFGANWYMFVENRGAGTLTITPTTSTIDGAASIALTTNQGILVASDGTNYFTMRGISSTGATLSAANVFTNVQTVTPYRANISGAVSIDMTVAKSNTLILTMTANVTSFAITNPVDGMNLNIWLLEDGTGGWTFAGLNSAFKFGGGAGTTGFVTTANARNLISANYGATEAVYLCGFTPGLS